MQYCQGDHGEVTHDQHHHSRGAQGDIDVEATFVRVKQKPSQQILKIKNQFNVFQLLSEEEIEKIISKLATAGQEHSKKETDVNQIKASDKPEVKARKLENVQRIFKTENRFSVFQQFSEAKIERLLHSEHLDGHSNGSLAKKI